MENPTEERIKCIHCSNTWPKSMVPEDKYDKWICQPCWYLAIEMRNLRKQEEYEQSILKRINEKNGKPY